MSYSPFPTREAAEQAATLLLGDYKVTQFGDQFGIGIFFGLKEKLTLQRLVKAQVARSRYEAHRGSFSIYRKEAEHWERAAAASWGGDTTPQPFQVPA